MKKRIGQFPGATPYQDRHGTRRWRYRKGGFSRELGTKYGSEEFCRRYDEAMADHRGVKLAGANAARTLPGSVNELVVLWYRSPAFLALAENTKRDYRGIIEKWRAEHGEKPVALLERRHLMGFLADKAETPSAANNLRKRLAQLLDHAVSLDWIKVNPARLTKPYKVSPGGYHTWEESEIERFFAVFPAGTLAHRAVTLMLYTGAARVDVVCLGWGNIRGSGAEARLEYRRSKTARSSGVLISIPLHPALAAVLNACPRDAFTFLQTDQGRSRSPDGLGNLMREWCNQVALPQCSSHGLRKACARRLAEAGATTLEIMAVTGHKTLSEVERYTAAAARQGLADSAIEKVTRSVTGQKVANHPAKFAKIPDNSLKRKGKK